jgi:putative transposase
MERSELTRPNEVWAMDFVSHAVFNGQRFRALTVVDAVTRECLMIEASQSLNGAEHTPTYNVATI